MSDTRPSSPTAPKRVPPSPPVVRDSPWYEIVRRGGASGAKTVGKCKSGAASRTAANDAGSSERLLVSIEAILFT
eukprot:6471984-Prymnesium_polylepis.2